MPPNALTNAVVKKNGSAVVIKNLVKRFGDFTAVDNVSLEVSRALQKKIGNTFNGFRPFCGRTVFDDVFEFRNQRKGRCHSFLVCRQPTLFNLEIYGFEMKEGLSAEAQKAGFSARFAPEPSLLATKFLRRPCRYGGKRLYRCQH